MPLYRVYLLQSKSRLHKIYMEQGQEHSGIVMGRQSYSIGEQLRGFLRLTYYQANKAEIEAHLVAEQAEYEHLAALHSQKMPEII